MRICADWLLTRGVNTRETREGKRPVFTSRQCNSIASLLSLGRDFLVRTHFGTITATTRILLLGALRRNRLWRMHRHLNLTLPRPCSHWAIFNTGRSVITRLPKSHSSVSVKCYQATATQHTHSVGLQGAREIGLRALHISSKLSY